MNCRSLVEVSPEISGSACFNVSPLTNLANQIIAARHLPCECSGLLNVRGRYRRRCVSVCIETVGDILPLECWLIDLSIAHWDWEISRVMAAIAFFSFGHYALVAPIIWWCHLSDVQQSVDNDRLYDLKLRLVTTGVHGCWTPCLELEHSAGGDNDVADTLYLPSTA